MKWREIRRRARAEKATGEVRRARRKEATVGEWFDEPNREEFEHAGLKCLILRHPELGHLNGYVTVPRGHPCYGKDYDGMPYEDLFPIEVHGGLTFSKEGDGDKWPEGWGFGFDCAHAWDLVPSMPMPLQLEQTTYRNFQYVRRETENLAEQLATLEFIDWEFCWVWPLLLPPGMARRMWIRASQKCREGWERRKSGGEMRLVKSIWTQDNLSNYLT